MFRRVDQEEAADDGEPDEQRGRQDDGQRACFGFRQAVAGQAKHGEGERRRPDGQRRNGVDGAGQHAGKNAPENGAQGPT